MLNKRILVLMFVVAFLFVGCLPTVTPPITPPTPKGISGRIMVPGPEATKDITGWIPVANATVTITDSEGVTHTVITDEDGYYTFTDIAVDANTIITATGTIDGNIVIVKDVIPQAVVADGKYDAGTADAESTALALIVEELLEQGVDLGDIDLEEIQGSDNFNEVVEQVDSILEENGNVTTDPGLTNTVGNVAEDIISPPGPSPEPSPEPTPEPTPEPSPPPVRYYTITATADPGGSISPSGDITVKEGSDNSFTITPDSVFYGIETVLVDGDLVAAVSPYTFTNVTDDHTIEATFFPLEPVYNQTQNLYYNTIQEAIDDASNPVNTILVAPGIYDEDVTINKSLILVSTEGKDNTTINGQNIGYTGAVKITANNVVLGGDGAGFTINGAGQAAVYFTPVSGCLVEGNDMLAASGKNALVTEGGQSNHTIMGNTFSGDPASQLVYVNGQTSVSLPSMNVNFIGNTFSGTATGPALGQEAADSTVSGNTFDTVTGYASLELWIGNTVNDNYFTADLPTGGVYILDNSGFGPGIPGGGMYVLDIAAALTNNTFLRAVTVEHNPLLPKIWAYIQDAVNEAVSGDTVEVSAGTYEESVTIDKAKLALKSAVPHGATIDGGTKAAILINAEGVTVDGFEILSSYVSAVYAYGGSDKIKVLNNTVAGGGIYIDFSQGVEILGNRITTASHMAIFCFGDTDIVIERNEVIDNANGILVHEADGATIKYNTVSGSSGDAAMQIVGSKNVVIEFNNITDNDAVGIQHGTAWWEAYTPENNVAHYNNIIGNELGVENWAETTFDARANWWGDISGPKAVTNPNGLGDRVSGNVNYEPWSDNPNL